MTRSSAHTEHFVCMEAEVRVVLHPGRLSGQFEASHTEALSPRGRMRRGRQEGLSERSGYRVRSMLADVRRDLVEPTTRDRHLFRRNPERSRTPRGDSTPADVPQGMAGLTLPTVTAISSAGMQSDPETCAFQDCRRSQDVVGLTECNRDRFPPEYGAVGRRCVFHARRRSQGSNGATNS
jgi:hypothetical protein